MDLCGDTSGCAFVLVNPRVRLVQTPEGVLIIRPPRIDIYGGLLWVYGRSDCAGSLLRTFKEL